MTLDELKEHCDKQTEGCDKCKRVPACHEFKRILETVIEPWEIHRLTEHIFSDDDTREVRRW